MAARGTGVDEGDKPSSKLWGGRFTGIAMSLLYQEYHLLISRQFLFIYAAWVHILVTS